MFIMNITLQGYHGTSKENAMKILQTKKFIPSGSYRDWLGHGVYFFENDDHQAYMIAKFRKGLDDNKISVIGAEIKSNIENILDLTIDKDRKFLEEYTETLSDVIDRMVKDIGDWEHKEGYVLDFLNARRPFNFVKACYKIPHKRKQKFLDYENSHIQICVKNTNCISQDSIREVDCSAYRRI